VIPSATTTRVWKRPHRSRSSRAGISVATIAALACEGACAATGTVTVMIASSWPHRAAYVQGNDLRAGAFRGAARVRRFPSPRPRHRLRPA
jgi:hypothetical protein